MNEYVWIVFNEYNEIMGVFTSENSANKLTEVFNTSSNDSEFYIKKYETEN